MKGTDNRWVKFHIKTLEWEWHDIPEMMSLFFHLVLLAQHKDYEWHGLVIKRGQLVTSIRKLSALTGISQRKLRTCMARMEATHELTQQTTHKNTLITICKYDKYQQNPKATDTVNDTVSDTLPTQQQTRYKDNNNIFSVVINGAHTREELFGQLMVEKACMALSIDQDTYRQLAEEVIAEWDFTEEADQSKRHFMNLMRIKVKSWKESQQNKGKKSKNEIQAEAMAMAQRAAYDRAKRYGTGN